MLTEKSHFPESLRTFHRVVSQFFNGDESEILGFRDALGLYFSDWSRPIEEQQERCYPSTPAELILIANYNVDEAHVGFVVHAPELKQADFPVGHFCEIDGDGVQFGGKDTRHFLAIRLAAIIGYWEHAGENLDDFIKKGYGKNRKEAEKFASQLRLKAHEHREKYMPLIQLLASELSIKPGVDTALFGWGYKHINLQPPHIPQNWRYESTEDNVGVLAPSELFDPAYTDDLADEDCIRASKQFLKRGFPATALYVLKQSVSELYWAEPERYPELLKDLINVYEALNRPLLAYTTRETLRSLEASDH